MSKKTLVLGASLKTDRYSNIAINRLRQNNHEVVAFGLKQGEVNDVAIDSELLDYKDVDTVTLYLSPKHQEAYYDYILGLKPKRVIFNPGTENPEFYEILKENTIEFEAACTLVLLSIDQY
ncbi:CoA-binding protein [Winogradskyella marincola]|uniref:CoA-binding protein n=1 Tax=Winogradskyella marincola TaxID=3037795 RepID=A0ABT6FX81_9FLAO|nr:CoA-binding protein [Winogradskyella sp. YYF002]MDG4714399.1 CoA-binding protein [Winogradskyella sp. YYF002]